MKYRTRVYVFGLSAVFSTSVFCGTNDASLKSTQGQEELQKTSEQTMKENFKWRNSANLDEDASLEVFKEQAYQFLGEATEKLELVRAKAQKMTGSNLAGQSESPENPEVAKEKEPEVGEKMPGTKQDMSLSKEGNASLKLEDIDKKIDNTLSKLVTLSDSEDATAQKTKQTIRANSQEIRQGLEVAWNKVNKQTADSSMPHEMPMMEHHKRLDSDQNQRQPNSKTQ